MPNAPLVVRLIFIDHVILSITQPHLDRASSSQDVYPSSTILGETYVAVGKPILCFVALSFHLRVFIALNIPFNQSKTDSQLARRRWVKADQQGTIRIVVFGSGTRRSRPNIEGNG